MARIKRGTGINIQVDTNLKVSTLFELPIKNTFTDDLAGSLALKSNNLLSYKDNAGVIRELAISGSGGTVTSVGLNTPIGFTITNSPITTSGVLNLTYTSGYSLPTIANQTNWTTAFEWGNHAGRYPLYNGTGATGVWGINISGNSASTTALQNNRTFWGQSYNGTQNVTGSLTGVTSLTASGVIIGETFYRTFKTATDIANGTYEPVATYGNISSNAVQAGLFATNNYLNDFKVGVALYTIKSSTVNIKALDLKYDGAAIFISSVTASSFAGAGTALTGIALDLTAGNSIEWNNQKYGVVELTTTPQWVMSYDTTNATWKPTGAAPLRTFLGLGSNAYTSAINLTTTGTGAATFNQSTGALNIPIASFGGSGTVTSVSITVPTGLTITGSPITTSGTFAVDLQSGYSIPTNTNQTSWTAKQNAISLTTTGTSGVATFNGTTLNIPNYATNISGKANLAGGNTFTGTQYFLGDINYSGTETHDGGNIFNSTVNFNGAVGIIANVPSLSFLKNGGGDITLRTSAGSTGQFIAELPNKSGTIAMLDDVSNYWNRNTSSGALSPLTANDNISFTTNKLRGIDINHTATGGLSSGIWITTGESTRGLSISGLALFPLHIVNTTTGTLLSLTNNGSFYLLGGLVAASAAVGVVTVTSNYIVGQATEQVILCNGTFTVSIPPGSLSKGYMPTVRNIGTGTITVTVYVGGGAGTGTNLIDGTTTKTVAAGKALTFVSDGSAYYIISQY